MTVDFGDLEEPLVTDDRPISWDDCPAGSLVVRTPFVRARVG